MTVVVTHSTPADGTFSATGATAWNADHTLSGVGTMAGQDANNVAITGGAIDGATVGATTTSTGAFTTLSASSTVSGTGFSTYLASPPAIGGTAASTGRFTTVTSTIATGTAPFTVASTTAVANLSIGGNAGTVTNGVYTTDTGTVTNTMLAGSIANNKLTNSSITFGATSQALGSTVSAISGVTIDNGVIGGTTAAAGTFATLISNSTAQFGKSSVNYLQAVGGATTVAPALTVQSSSDTNVDFSIKALGTGSTLIGTGNGTAISAADSGSTIAWWQFTGTASSTGNLISRVGGGGTNTTLISVAKGTGSIQFATNNTATNVQIQVSNTASAVNYVQVTGGTTVTKTVTVSAQGSDTDVDLALVPKGAGRVTVSTSIKPKVSSAANVTSPLAWNSTSFDEYAITALANALTINADANASPADGQKMLFRFKDNGTARALTWTTGATNAFRAVGITLPTTTVVSKLVYVGCIYNAADSRWDAIAVSQEA